MKMKIIFAEEIATPPMTKMTALTDATDNKLPYFLK